MVSCSCDWQHPQSGEVYADWPAELDPRCRVHGVGQWSQAENRAWRPAVYEFMRAAAALWEEAPVMDPREDTRENRHAASAVMARIQTTYKRLERLLSPDGGDPVS